MKKPLISFNDVPEVMASILENQQAQTKLLNELKDKHSVPTTGKEILTIAETAEFLGINRTTLWAWEKKGSVKSYGIDGRRYFKRVELLEALVPINH